MSDKQSERRTDDRRETDRRPHEYFERRKNDRRKK